MLKRGIAAAAIAATALLGGGFALAPTASAVTPPAGCNSGALCAYWTSNYSGSVQRVYQDNTDLTMYTNFYNSEGGSLFNNGSQCNVEVYSSTNYNGAGYRLNRGTGWSYIASNLPHIESNYWCGY